MEPLDKWGWNHGEQGDGTILDETIEPFGDEGMGPFWMRGVEPLWMYIYSNYVCYSQCVFWGGEGEGSPINK